VSENFGLRIATKDASALKQADKFVSYSSKFSTPKIFKKGSVSITTDGSGDGNTKIKHGLGYAPTFYVFRKDDADFSFLDGTTYSNVFHAVPGTFTPWTSFQETSDSYTDAEDLNIIIEGANSTTYNFTYFIFIDQAEFNEAPGLSTSNDFGMKIAAPNENANTAVEQKVQLSSAYRNLKYFNNFKYDYADLNLPELSGDYFDTDPQEGTYVDFFHGLGYAPFFLAYVQESGQAERFMVPNGSYGFGDSKSSLSGWSNKDRVRITFYRKAFYNTTAPNLSTSWSDTTLSIRVYIFLEDLNTS